MTISWYREWAQTAAANDARGDAALAAGNLATARNNWLRAIGYTPAAASPFDFQGQNRDAPVVAMRYRCREVSSSPQACQAKSSTSPGAPMSRCRAIICRRNPPWDSPPAKNPPAVICIGEPGHRKEEFLYKAARHASERGLSLLAVDVLGDQPDRVAGNGTGRPRSRSPRSDVSWTICAIGTTSITTGSRSWPMVGALPLSHAASPPTSGLRRRCATAASGMRRNAPSCRAARQLTASNYFTVLRQPHHARHLVPLLITTGESGWLQPERVMELVDRVKGSREDVTLKIFGRGNRGLAGPPTTRRLPMNSSWTGWPTA